MVHGGKIAALNALDGDSHRYDSTADCVQTMVLAISQGMIVGDLADTIVPCLTTVEGLKLAAQGFAKEVCKLSCCAG